MPHLLGLQHPQPLSVPHRFLDHVHVHRRLAQHPREEGPDDWVRQTGELSVCAGNGGDATRDQGDGVYGENMVRCFLTRAHKPGLSWFGGVFMMTINIGDIGC